MTDAPNQYPGQRLGLPASGFGSIGRPGRRIGALVIDYAAAYLLTAAFVPPLPRGDGLVSDRFIDINGLAILGIFVALQILFIPTLGGSPGHRLVGLRLVRLDGAWTGLIRPIVRSLLLAVVVPAVVWDPDQRGLHDKAAGTILLRAPSLFERAR